MIRIKKQVIGDKYKIRRCLAFTLRGKEYVIGLRPLKYDGYWCLYKKTIEKTNMGNNTTHSYYGINRIHVWKHKTV